MAQYLEYNRQYTYYNALSQANFRMVGDVFQLPAGPVQVSPGAEVIWSQYRTRATVGVSEAIRTAIPSGIIGPSNTRDQQARRTESVFFESVIPLIGPKWRPLPLESVDLNLGARWEGTDDSTKETSPVAALLIAPTKDVAFRVSYAEGFFPPDQSQYENARVNPAAITPFTDPARGNITYNYPHEEISGGNPDLKPETSKAWNYGVILTPRVLPGLSFTVDFWEIEKVNAILQPTGPSAILAAPDSYPGRVVRAAPTATDLANGWLGAVTSVDYRAVNVGFTQTEGIDFKVRYRQEVEGPRRLHVRHERDLDRFVPRPDPDHESRRRARQQLGQPAHVARQLVAVLGIWPLDHRRDRDLHQLLQREHDHALARLPDRQRTRRRQDRLGHALGSPGELPGARGPRRGPGLAQLAQRHEVDREYQERAQQGALVPHRYLQLLQPLRRSASALRHPAGEEELLIPV
jgi:hypothetical protein